MRHRSQTLKVNSGQCSRNFVQAHHQSKNLANSMKSLFHEDQQFSVDFDTLVPEGHHKNQLR